MLGEINSGNGVGNIPKNLVNWQSWIDNPPKNCIVDENSITLLESTEGSIVSTNTNVNNTQTLNVKRDIINKYGLKIKPNCAYEFSCNVETDFGILNQDMLEVGISLIDANYNVLQLRKIKDIKNKITYIFNTEEAQYITFYFEKFAENAKIRISNVKVSSVEKYMCNLNVFAQLAEPKAKDGIWIKTEKTVTIEGYTQLTNIPYEFSNGSVVAIGKNIYLFGGTGNLKTAYKHDTLTNKYTKLADMPLGFYNGCAITIGTDIYLLGNATTVSSENNYKYNTLTNKYTKLTDIPYFFIDGSAVAVGTNIYMFGSSNASYSNSKKAYQYDTLTDTYTKLANVPYEFYSGCAVAVGTDIYLLGGSESSTRAYKYNTLTDTYTQLANVPYSFYESSATAIGTDIYLLGSSNSSNSKVVYEYDTLTDTYTKMTDIPYKFYNGSAVAINSNIYMLGGEDLKTTTYRYNTNKEYKEIEQYNYANILIASGIPTTPQNGDIYVLYGDKYATKLLEQLVLKFSDIFFYKDNETQMYPIYLGNGQEWVKILN